MSSVEERVGRLERSARRWKLAAGLAVGLLVLSGAKARPPYLECRGLAVVDESTGETRVDIGLANGSPSLLMWGPDAVKDDKAGVSLGVSRKHGGLLVVRDARGEAPKVYGPDD